MSAQVPSINAPPPIDRVPKPTFGSYLENLGIGYGEELGKQVRDIGGMVERGVSAFAQDPLKASAAAFMSVLEPARQGFTQPVQTAKDVGAGVVETGRQMATQAQSGPIGLGGVAGQIVGLPGPDMPGRRKPTMAELDVYHGTPHTFDPETGAPLGRFRSEKIGTGEGAQAYGYGLYLAENQKVAGGYRSSLSPQPFPDKDPRNGAWIIYNNKGEDAARKYLSEDFPADQVENALAEVKAAKSGNVYKVDLPDAKIEQMLDWDRPLSEQPQQVRDALLSNPAIAAEVQRINEQRIRLNEQNPARLSNPVVGKLASKETTIDSLKGQAIYELLAKGGNQAQASEYLRSLGIPGIKYLDEGSRGNFRVQNKYKGQNYGEAVSFKTEQQAKDYAAEQVAKGFEADVQPGTRNFVVFPGEEQSLTVLERNGERAVAPKAVAPKAKAAPQYNFKKESQRVSNLVNVENVSLNDYEPKTKKLNTTYAQPAEKDRFGYLQKFKLSRKMGDDQSINVYVGTDELGEDLPDPRFDPNDPPYMFGSYVDYSGETAPKGTGALTQMTLEALEIVKRDKGKKSGWISEGIRSAETDAKYERLIAAGVPFQRTETGTYFLMPQDLQALDLSKVSDALNKKYGNRTPKPSSAN